MDETPKITEKQRYFVIKKYVVWGTDSYEVTAVKPVRAVQLRDDDCKYFGGYVQEGEDYTLEEVMALKEVLCLVFLDGGNGQEIVKVPDLFFSREAAEKGIQIFKISSLAGN